MPAMHLLDISDKQIFLLASVFHQPNSEPETNYTERVCCIEPQLDRVLLRPDFFRRLIQPPQSRYTPLCALHKILNAKIVHELFVLVSTEVGVRLNRLVVAGRDRIGCDIWDNSILNLRSLHGAWLHPEVFCDTFGATLEIPHRDSSHVDYMTKWSPEKSKCEACILKRIGGDLNTVLDLHMVVKSRTRTRSSHKRHHPRLTTLIDGWLKQWRHHFNPTQWEEKLEKNYLRASQLKEVRKSLAMERGKSSQRHRHKMTESQSENSFTASVPATSHGHQRLGDDESSKLRQNFHRSQSYEAIKIYLSPELDKDRKDAEPLDHDEDNDDDQEEEVVRKSLYAAENDIIDSYAALISTPFLPGMKIEEHQKRNSTLSRHRSAMITQVDNLPWPMVGDERADKTLTRSQSTKNRGPSVYSESVYSQLPSGDPKAAYIPPRQQWANLGDLKQKQTVSEKRQSGASWVTASVAASQLTQATQASRSNANHGGSTKPNLRFDTIAEETDIPKRYNSKFREGPISPLKEASHEEQDVVKSAFHTGGDSPVSPLSPLGEAVLPSQASNHNRRDYSLREAKIKSHRKDVRPVDTSLRSGPQASAQRDSTPQKMSSRLSKPFNEPVALLEPNSLLNSVRQLRHRDRDSDMTDLTRWSALYGQEADRIKAKEAQPQNLPSRSDSRARAKQQKKR